MGELKKQLRTLASGLLAMLPLVLTLAVLAWVGNLFQRFLGPESLVGRGLSRIGMHVAENPLVAYFLGIVVFLCVAYLVGLGVQSRFERHWRGMTERTLKRVPLIGPVYDLTSRFVGMIDRKSETQLDAMSPVCCLFGGAGGVAVMGLMPSREPVEIDGVPHLPVLVPTAPVPIGGGLIYVPAESVRPAGFGVDRFTSVYVSMGVVPPRAG
jgi:uncharacterized membrane protein